MMVPRESDAAVLKRIQMVSICIADIVVGTTSRIAHIAKRCSVVFPDGMKIGTRKGQLCKAVPIVFDFVDVMIAKIEQDPAVRSP